MAVKSFITLLPGPNITFFVRNLRIFVISWSDYSWQTFPALSNVWGERPEAYAEVEHQKGHSLG
jgi:hypothetical protein